MDCWGVVRYFYNVYYNIVLPEFYNETPETEEAGEIVKTKLDKFYEVKTPNIGDIVLLKMYGVPSHTAIYIDSRNILHTTKNTGSILEPISRWKNLIVGYYRIRND